MRYIFVFFLVSVVHSSCNKEYSNGLDFSPNRPQVGSTVHFDAPNASGCHYTWDFGDGSTDNSDNSFKSHSYATEGSYYVTVNLDENGTAVASYFTTITIRQ